MSTRTETLIIGQTGAAYVLWHVNTTDIVEDFTSVSVVETQQCPDGTLMTQVFAPDLFWTYRRALEAAERRITDGRRYFSPATTYTLVDLVSMQPVDSLIVEL